MTSEQLNARLVRERGTYLRSLGFESEEQLRQYQQVELERQAAEAAARRDQQSREQNLQEDVTAREAERDAALAEAETLRFHGHVTEICAALGVRNTDYAMHLIERAAEVTPEGEQLDVEAYLRERIDPEQAQHAAMRAALGIEATTTTTVPITTTGANPPPPPPPPGNREPGDFDAMEADSKAWAARMEGLGLG